MRGISSSHYSPRTPWVAGFQAVVLVHSPQLVRLWLCLLSWVRLSPACCIFFYHVHVKRKQYFLGSYYCHQCEIGVEQGVASLQLAAASHRCSMEKFIGPTLLISIFLQPLLSPKQGLFTFIRPTWLFSSTESAAPWGPSSCPFIVVTGAQDRATCK